MMALILVAIVSSVEILNIGEKEMKNILCFGDSNTYGFDIDSYDMKTSQAGRLPFDVRWPGRVQLQLGAEYRVIEAGLNGRAIMMEDPFKPYRKGIQSLPAALDCQSPLDLVILHLGVNELKTYFNLSAGMIARGIENMILLSQMSYNCSPVPQVLVIAPPPVGKNIEKSLFGDQFGSLAYEKSLLFGRQYQAVAEKHGCGFLDAGKLGFELNPIDELHYCAADHAKLANAAAVKIVEMIG
jgi:lysophospholipase L1-like esterase